MNVWNYLSKVTCASYFLYWKIFNYLLHFFNIKMSSISFWVLFFYENFLSILFLGSWSCYYHYFSLSIPCNMSLFYYRYSLFVTFLFFFWLIFPQDYVFCSILKNLTFDLVHPLFYIFPKIFNSMWRLVFVISIQLWSYMFYICLVWMYILCHWMWFSIIYRF